jgi:hypothetical protein
VGLVAASAAFAAPPAPIELPVGGPVGSISTHRAGAQPVAVSLAMPTMTVCGQPRPGRVLVTFPNTAAPPRSIARAAVRVNGSTPARVAVAGDAVTLTLARPAGITCNVVARGMLKLVFTRAARLANPTTAGIYTITVRRSTGAPVAFSFHVA